jgi:serine protease Do
MNTQNVLAQCLDAIFQIYTPFGSGSGFAIGGYIVTNSHVVSGMKNVVISSSDNARVEAKVVYDDPSYDMAFIEFDAVTDSKILSFSQESVKAGDSAIAIGHPYGLNYSSTEGIVSKAARLQGELEYIQIDTAINPGNSGGPLLNIHGHVIGMNTFIILNSNNLGFALPYYYIEETLETFKAKHRHKHSDNESAVIRCISCKNMIFESDIKKDYCPICGVKLDIAKQRREGYKPIGTVKLLESILEEMKIDVSLARESQNSWRIRVDELSRIDMNYYDNGIIIADATLCRIPTKNIDTIYNYLLSENEKLEYLQFSINENSIYLSYLIVDTSLTYDEGMEALKRLFKKLKTYREKLLSKFEAVPFVYEDN